MLDALRATATFQRLEALRQVLSHYDSEPPVGATLDALLPDGMSAALAAASQAGVIALPGPRVDVA